MTNSQKAKFHAFDENGVLTFPDEMIEKLGWKEGDVLQWIDNKDGSFLLKKDEGV